MEYPVTVEALLTVGGVALFGSAVTQWLKHYLKEWRYIQLLVLVICIIASIVAGFIDAAWHPTDSAFLNALMTGFWGATLATFGYEAVQNWRGLIGAGPRK